MFTYLHTSRLCIICVEKSRMCFASLRCCFYSFGFTADLHCLLLSFKKSVASRAVILHFFMVNWWSASLTDLGVIVTDLKNCFAAYLIIIIDLYSSFSLSLSPWYNHNGWLDIKHQVTYSPSLFSALSDNILPFSWQTVHHTSYFSMTSYFCTTFNLLMVNY